MNYIKTDYGAIRTNGLKCNFTINGVRYMNIDGYVPGIHYGLIEYDCGGTIGSAVSKMECKPCGLFCKQNEFIVGCEQEFFPIMLGVIIGTLLSILSHVVYSKFIKSRLVSYYLNCRKTQSEKRKCKRVKRARKIANHIKELEESDPDLREEEIVRHIREETEKYKAARNVYPSLVGIPTVLFLLFLAVLCLGCDNTLFIKSNGIVCNSNDCSESQTYDISLSSLSPICFKNEDGNLTTIRLYTSKMMYRSKLVYYTSDIDLQVSQHWNCLGSGECWYEQCHHNSQAENHIRILKNSNRTTIKNAGCSWQTAECSKHCTHQRACVYHLWSISPKGVLYPVYQTVAYYWSITILIENKGVTTKYELSANNPSLNLITSSEVSLPVVATSFNSERQPMARYFIQYGGKFYNIEASGINMPVSNLVGDFQISLDNGSLSYNTETVTCSSAFCLTLCRIPEPRIKRFIRHVDNYEEYNGLLVGDKHNALIEQPVYSSIRLLVGNVNLKNLEVINSKCEIDIIGTYACTGCHLESYAVIQSSKIVNEGSLIYNSNCTFDRKYLSCNPTSYKIKLLSHKSTCYIHIPSLNRTLHLNFNFIFKGNLDPTHELYATPSQYEEVVSIVSSRNFLSSISLTLAAYSIATMIFSLIMRFCSRTCWSAPFSILALKTSKGAPKTEPTAPTIVQIESKV